MKVAASIAFAFALAGVIGLAKPDAARAQATPGSEARPMRPGQITIVGEGTMAATPDMATVSTSVVTAAKTAKEALDANTAALSAVIDRFKAAGIAPKDLATSGFSVQPRYSYPKPQNGSTEAPRIDGYEVRNGVTIRVRDLGKLGSILDTAVTAGANQISGIAFDVAEPSALMDKAGVAAIADARRRAELFAEAAGVKLGRVVAVSEPSLEAPRPRMMVQSAEFAAKAAAVPIETGEREFNVRVRVTWEIAQ
ncbi:SIMPL domain-containing protein [Chelatococcus sp. GCM10030263]|uniref:SIMPL domain-containing protein n=1 Tax=Chelatococcus sp. GCM10030263 TaxID=3273387 RepID=UPI003616D452